MRVYVWLVVAMTTDDVVVGCPQECALLVPVVDVLVKQSGNWAIIPDT